MTADWKPPFAMFRSQAWQLAKGLPMSFARATDINPNRYEVVHSQGYGMMYSVEERRFPGVLNVSTTTSDTIELSADGRPLIWFDAEHVTLAAFLESEPMVLKPTGRTRTIKGREVPEVEILMTEDELARVCSYCSLLENVNESKRLTRYAGEGYRSFYWCDSCASSSVRRWKLAVNRWLGIRRYP